MSLEKETFVINLEKKIPNGNPEMESITNRKTLYIFWSNNFIIHINEKNEIPKKYHQTYKNQEEALEDIAREFDKMLDHVELSE